MCKYAGQLFTIRAVGSHPALALTNILWGKVTRTTGLEGLEKCFSPKSIS